MSIGLKLSTDSKLDLKRVYKGDLTLFSTIPCSKAMVTHALTLKDEYLSEFEPLDFSCDSTFLNNFVTQATKLKKRFTNGDDTMALLEQLIEQRYQTYLMYGLFYDVPRLRVIPNSEVIRSGISYNYQPHRDTWYGSQQSQVNHWMAVENVTIESSFYIAPAYFHRPIRNTSKSFDLDEWDNKYRPVAEKSIESENRPHPSPLEVIDDKDRLIIDIDPGGEIVFSAHHLHGSSPNTTNKIRLSIDYRVFVPELERISPLNIDCESTGDYLKFMIRHPRFG
jgi:hypothetical protein